MRNEFANLDRTPKPARPDEVDKALAAVGGGVVTWLSRFTASMLAVIIGNLISLWIVKEYVVYRIDKAVESIVAPEKK